MGVRSVRGLRLIAIGLALTLVAAACGDDDTATEPTDPEAGEGSTTTTSEDPDPTTSEPEGEEPDPSAPLTASWKGVTEDTVSIGVSLLDFDVLKSMGLQDFGWGDQRLIWDFYLEQLNERGGVAGRQVDAELDFYNPALALEAEASCLRMTQDRDVFAVIGSFLGPAETATPCLTDQEDLVVFGGTMTVELLEGAKGVWVGDSMADRRRIPAFFELLSQAGYIDGRPVAVVSGDENESDTENVIVPILEDLDVEVVASAVNNVPTDDVIEEDRFWDTTAQRIEAAGAEVIIINGDTTGAIRGITRNNLDQELWVVTASQLVNLGTTVQPADADGAITTGSAEEQEVWEEPAMAACVKEFTDAHPEADVQGPSELGEGDERWDRALTLACRWLSVFETLMNAAGPELTPESIKAAYEGYGEVMLPGYVYASWGPDKPDANDGLRLSEWDSTAGENGSLVPLTDLLDTTP